MPATVESLGIDRLTADEQLALVHAIWDRIAATGPAGALLTPEARAELRRRVAECEADPGIMIPWDRVKAESQLRSKV